MFITPIAASRIARIFTTLSYHCPYTYLPQVQQAVQCPGGASIPAQVGPGDPVEGLRVLRQQLEVALAGVRAQEAELQRQRAATGREEEQQGRGGRAARTPRSE